MKYTINLFILSLLSIALTAQQYADSTYSPPEFKARYEAGKGQAVYIDEAHHNFHTKDGRYAPFAHILELDGYTVEANREPFSRESLAGIKILVVSNALPETSTEEWIAPTQSAFSPEEIIALKNWVKKGGGLFLIADHMPMAGAARDLAAAFGYTFYDCFADDTTSRSGTEFFCKADRSLSDNEITRGIGGMLAADSVTSFTGQAFIIPENANSILNCGHGWIVAMPDTAWQFNENTRRINAEGWSQGSCEEFGKGRLVVFGEAAMFSAQIAESNGQKFTAGMNSESGKNNYRLLVNLVRWLDN